MICVYICYIDIILMYCSRYVHDSRIVKAQCIRLSIIFDSRPSSFPSVDNVVLHFLYNWRTGLGNIKFSYEGDNHGDNYHNYSWKIW